jgi:hypothetical protein
MQHDLGLFIVGKEICLFKDNLTTDDRFLEDSSNA